MSQKTSSTTYAVEIQNLSKGIAGKQLYRDFSYTFESGKITTLFGPNGCGKSTLFNIIVGLLEKDTGSIVIAEKHIPMYIFQNYRTSLFPWRTNRQNVAFALEVQKLSQQAIYDRIEELETLFPIPFDWNSYPYQLSGGQQQMLALFRALITKPKLLLIDEPFSALDYENTLKMRDVLQKYYLQEKPTVLMISHDIDDAIFLSHNVLVLSKNPTTVAHEVVNADPYPRSIEHIKSSHFHDLRNVALTQFTQSL